jgi:superfamily II DNA/RNA helicase
VLGRAQTGSGKTLAFGVPMLARIADAPATRRRNGSPRGLVLVPTRELAGQVRDALEPLGHALGLKTVAVYGGAAMGRQIAAMHKGVDVVVATPGRLIDLIERGECSLAEVSITVLDEADFMADLGFLPVVQRLLDMTPAKGQRLLFSATLDGAVDRLVRTYLRLRRRSLPGAAPGHSCPPDRLMMSSGGVLPLDSRGRAVREVACETRSVRRCRVSPLGASSCRTPRVRPTDATEYTLVRSTSARPGCCRRRAHLRVVRPPAAARDRARAPRHPRAVRHPDAHPARRPRRARRARPAQTGSGKTLAFGVPMLARIADAPATRRRNGSPRGLVLVPTRELAGQVRDALEPLGHALGLKTVAVYGGAAMGRQIAAMHKGVDVVVATPGRLIDLIERGECSLAEVASPCSTRPTTWPTSASCRRHGCSTDAGGSAPAFSATSTAGVASLVRLLEPGGARRRAAPRTWSTMDHASRCGRAQLDVAARSRPRRPTCLRADQARRRRLAKQLRKAGVETGAIHGNLTQHARKRAPRRLPHRARAVLGRDDVAARGIHVDDVDLVVHFDPPADHKDYLHRSGRTARAGASGVVVSLAAAVRDRRRRAPAPASRRPGTARRCRPGPPGHPRHRGVGRAHRRDRFAAAARTRRRLEARTASRGPADPGVVPSVGSAPVTVARVTVVKVTVVKVTVPGRPRRVA